MPKMMLWLLLLIVAEVKKRGKRKIDEFRKKLMIPKYEMAECSEYKVKSNIGKIFANENILGEYSVKVYEIDSYLYEH